MSQSSSPAPDNYAFLAWQVESLERRRQTAVVLLWIVRLIVLLFLGAQWTQQGEPVFPGFSDLGRNPTRTGVPTLAILAAGFFMFDLVLQRDARRALWRLHELSPDAGTFLTGIEEMEPRGKREREVGLARGLLDPVVLVLYTLPFCIFSWTQRDLGLVFLGVVLVLATAVAWGRSGHASSKD